MKTFKAFVLITSISLFMISGSTRAAQLFRDKDLAESVTETQEALYKENPWLFIQKKLIEEPNDELLSLGSIFLDALVLGGSTLGVFFSGYPKTALLIGTLIFVAQNYASNNSSKRNALQSFLKRYQKYPNNHDHGNYKKYTPEVLWPLFDQLSSLPAHNLNHFLQGSSFYDLLKDLKQMAKKNNPSFNAKDMYYQKLKYVGIGSVSITGLFLLCMIFAYLYNINNETVKIRREVDENNNSLLGLMRIGRAIGAQIRRDSTHQIARNDQASTNAVNFFENIVTEAREVRQRSRTWNRTFGF